MPDAFLDSSVVIGLLFRNAGERAACLKAIPEDAARVGSRYVQFEIARGFLRSLILLHNASFEYPSFSALHQAAHSGQRRFKPYEMQTWLGAFDDYFAALEAEDGAPDPDQQLNEFRAKLWSWIRRGWRKLQADFVPLNAIGCREDLPPPLRRSDQRVDQLLPLLECGNPAACRLQAFVDDPRASKTALAVGLDRLPEKQKDSETIRHIDALRELLAVSAGTEFTGSHCHRAGDGLIAIEMPVGHLVVTKNRKHFEPITPLLGKPFAIALPARSTQAPDS